MSRSVRSTASAMASSLAPNKIAGNRRDLMRVVVVRHHEEDSAGVIGAAFEARGATLSTLLYPKEGALPDTRRPAPLLIVGSTPPVHDEGRARAPRGRGRGGRGDRRGPHWAARGRRGGGTGAGVLLRGPAAGRRVRRQGGARGPAGDRLGHDRLGRPRADPAGPVAGVPSRPVRAARRGQRARPQRPGGAGVPPRPASRGPVPPRGRRRPVAAMAGRRGPGGGRGERPGPGPDARANHRRGAGGVRPGRPARRRRAAHRGSRRLARPGPAPAARDPGTAAIVRWNKTGADRQLYSTGQMSAPRNHPSLAFSRSDTLAPSHTSHSM